MLIHVHADMQHFKRLRISGCRLLLYKLKYVNISEKKINDFGNPKAALTNETANMRQS
jgi:hypothetical protein